MLSFATDHNPLPPWVDLMTALEQLRHIKRGLAGNALKLAPYAAYELAQPTCNLQRYRRDAPEIPGICRVPDVFACQRDVSSPVSGLSPAPASGV